MDRLGIFIFERCIFFVSLFRLPHWRTGIIRDPNQPIREDAIAALQPWALSDGMVVLSGGKCLLLSVVLSLAAETLTRLTAQCSD